MPGSKLRILDGVNCIGGNKIAVISGGEAVFLDFGVNMKKRREYILGYRALTVANKLYYYLYSEILPRVSGVYRDDLIELDERVRKILERSEKLDTSLCVISHAHVDHYGALGFLSEEVSIAVSNSMKTIMRAMVESSATDIEAEVFEMRNRRLGRSGKIARKVTIFREGAKISDAPFQIIPYPIDHSIPASFGFLVEDLSLAYTGDIRRHGILRGLTDRFLDAIRGVDYLLMEGTRIDSSIMVSEEEVLEEVRKYLKEKSDKLACVIVSPTDIDRMRSLIQLSEELGKTPVICPRAAHLIDSLASLGTRISLPDLRNVGIYFERRSLTGDGYDLKSTHYRGWLKKTYLDRIDGRKPGNLVKANEISTKQKDYLLILGGLDQVLELAQIKPEPGSRLIVLTSEPHDEEQEIEWSKFERWVHLLRLDLRTAHSSGHADRETIIEMVNEIKPKTLIPVHTENPYEFQRLAGAGELKCDVILPRPGRPIAL